MSRLGPFELIRKLGAGATAEVFLATGPNARGEELMALKVMLPHLAEDEPTRRAFLLEGRTSAVLRHPNIVEIYDVGEVEGRAYLAMELVRGWSVSALLKKLKAAKEQLLPDEGCEVVRQAALGLHFAHEIRGADGKPLGLVHRDVSPQNLIVSERGEVKVADFGLAKATAAQATVTKGIKGKLKYMPPEQLKGEPLDARCDVFALGAVLWELVTGQPLYPGNSEAEIFQQALFNPQPHPDEVARGLSRSVVEVLRRAVERDVTKRCPTALALAEQLLPLIQPGESAQRLGARIEKHFEPLPRGTAETPGGASTQPVRRRSVLSPPRGPPPRMDALQDPNDGASTEPRAALSITGALQDPNDGPATMASLPPVMDEPPRASSPTIMQLTPLDTLHDDGSTASNTFPTLSNGRKKKNNRLQVIALAFAGLGIFAAAVVGGRFFSQRVLADAPSSFEELPDDPSPAVDVADPPIEEERVGPGPMKPIKPSGKRQKDVVKGFVTIDANVPARVVVGGKDVGLTPIKLTLPVGKHRLKLATPDGAQAGDLDLTIIAGGNGRRTVVLR